MNQTPWYKKSYVIAAFATGFFLIVAAIIRSILTKNEPPPVSIAEGNKTPFTTPPVTKSSPLIKKAPDAIFQEEKEIALLENNYLALQPFRV